MDTTRFAIKFFIWDTCDLICWNVKERTSIDNQKGDMADQRCSVENQKGAIATDFVQQ